MALSYLLNFYGPPYPAQQQSCTRNHFVLFQRHMTHSVLTLNVKRQYLVDGCMTKACPITLSFNRSSC